MFLSPKRTVPSRNPELVASREAEHHSLHDQNYGEKVALQTWHMGDPNVSYRYQLTGVSV